MADGAEYLWISAEHDLNLLSNLSMIYIHIYIYIIYKKMMQKASSWWWDLSNKPSLCSRKYKANINGNSRILKWRVLYHSKAIFCWDIPLHRPYIGFIYGRYLQFRFLKWPLIAWYRWTWGNIGGWDGEDSDLTQLHLPGRTCGGSDSSWG